MRKELITTFKGFLNENRVEKHDRVINNPSDDYSGEYENLYYFILDNNLQQIFVDKYSSFDQNLTIENWEDFVRGEMGYDEEIIEELVGNGYKVYYDDSKDSFIIKKKKTKNINYTIVPSDDESITDILNLAGIHSEYEPRFAVMLNNEIVGGSTYKIDEDNIYNFDIGILDEYQGYGISKELISNIIYDAKVLKADGIKAQVVNNSLFDYLTTIGFEGSINSEIRYVYKMF